MMTKKEFIQQAAIELAAALIQPYNSTAEGLSKMNKENLTVVASEMAIHLANSLEYVVEEYVDFPVFEIFAEIAQTISEADTASEEQHHIHTGFHLLRHTFRRRHRTNTIA